MPQFHQMPVPQTQAQQQKTDEKSRSMKLPVASRLCILTATVNHALRYLGLIRKQRRVIATSRFRPSHRRWAVFALMLLPIVSRAQGSSNTTAFFIDSQGPITLEHYSAGQKLRIAVQLSTTDEISPESSEGEGCINLYFQSQLLGSHGLNIPCDVNLNYNVLYTVPSDSGYDLIAQFPTFDGDESATVTVTVNPVEVITSTEDEILHFEAIARGLAQGIINAQAVERFFCPLVPTEAGKETCERLETALEDEYEAQLMYYEKLAAQDPIDSNFTTIAIPQQSPPLPKGDDAVTGTANALILNEQSQSYLLEAIITSINRAAAALQAGDDHWRKRQLTAAGAYLLTLSALIRAEIPLQTALNDVWTAAGYPALVPTATDLHNVQLALYSTGFSGSEVQQLEQDGLSSQDISTLTTQLVTLDYFPAQN